MSIQVRELCGWRDKCHYTLLDKVECKTIVDCLWCTDWILTVYFCFKVSYWSELSQATGWAPSSLLITFWTSFTGWAFRWYVFWQTKLFTLIHALSIVILRISNNYCCWIHLQVYTCGSRWPWCYYDVRLHYCLTYFDVTMVSDVTTGQSDITIEHHDNLQLAFIQCFKLWLITYDWQFVQCLAEMSLNRLWVVQICQHFQECTNSIFFSNPLPPPYKVHTDQHFWVPKQVSHSITFIV